MAQFTRRVMAKRHFTAEEVLNLMDSTEEEEEEFDGPMMEVSDYEFSDMEDNVDEDVPNQGRHNNYYAKTW